MTIVKNHKEYEIKGVTYFVEQYKHKEMSVFLWRYGYLVTTQAVPYTVVLRSGFLSRPNLRKLFGS